ncbi:glycosyltransferase family 4 protein [Rhodanobacter sp. AS-Z3]|uniref:glycosyltransferase family 4 protein n=1 Tax=Rhodanobacter sp. AS-Z3 TaxID=3031330 RepID=UPI0024787563|nr:glycosyltransferase family 4 protein [Rhodanobacter sp. AS-Z3]WEN13466.1 glycosyltransferase family 4 protein [Rhodanobacter sp. AS-Z3]
MNFLLVGTCPDNNGAATHFVALALALVEAGHHVTALVYPDSLVAQSLSRSAVHLRAAKFRNAFDPRGYTALWRAVRQTRPDWLVGNSGKEYWPLIISGRILGIPVALFRHRTPAMKRLSGYFTPRLAQRFFAVSWHARQAYLSRGIPAARVHVLYNPVDLETCRPDPQQRQLTLERLGIDNTAIVLGYFGRMHTGKGIFPLFEAANQAMAREPRLHCLWVGSGGEAGSLRALAAAHPMASRHHFVSWVNDTHPLYSAISMLAFPSISPEAFGRVAIEAQAHGVPVLASDAGGIAETIANGHTGMLLPPGDVGAWGDAIIQLCDPAIRLPMGEAAREFAQQNFSFPVIAAEFVRILQPITGTQPEALSSGYVRRGL